MNIAMLPVLFAAGFGVSFLVLDICRFTARRHWPAADGALSGRFRPFPVFLALFAGPALFAAATWRMRLAGTLSPVEVTIAGAIAAGWASCYGLLVAQGAWLLLPGGPLRFWQ